MGRFPKALATLQEANRAVLKVCRADYIKASAAYSMHGNQKPDSSTIAGEALEQIGAPFDIERSIAPTSNVPRAKAQ